MNTSHRLITCILPRGVASTVIRRLKNEKGIAACNINLARGVGRFTHRSVQRLGDVSEKEILKVVTSAERSDEIFEFIFYEADVNRPHGGMIFVQRLRKVSHFELPELPEESD